MKIFHDFESLSSIKNPVLTIGTFDGVHLGHQKILRQLEMEAEKIGGESVLFTFYPHPRIVLFPDSHGLKLIQTQEEKEAKLSRMGLQNLIIHPFTSEFANLTAQEFVENFLVEKLKVKKVVIGHDHQFGKNREGSLSFLQEMGAIHSFDVIEIPAQEIDEVNISSTKVRNAIEKGDIATAIQYLGEPFELNGKVIKGNQLGRTISYPTANLEIEEKAKIIPHTGVYSVIVVLPSQKKYFGMMNIGYRPTVSMEMELRLEVHLFDYEGDLYNQSICVQLLHRIRDEKKFPSIEHLKSQLKNDEKISRQYLALLP